MSFKIQIVAKDVSVKVLVENTDTMAAVKEKTEAALRDERSVTAAAATMEMRFSGKALDNDGATVEECGFDENCIVKLKYSAAAVAKEEGGEAAPAGPQPVMNITLKTLAGRSVTVPVVASDTILFLKEKVDAAVRAESGEPIPPPQQRIVHNNKPLNDTQLVGDCGINDGDTLSLILRLAKKEEEQSSSPPASSSGSGPEQKKKKKDCVVM